MDILRSTAEQKTTDTYGWRISLAFIANPMQVVAGLSLLPGPDPDKEAPSTRRLAMGAKSTDRRIGSLEAGAFGR